MGVKRLKLKKRLRKKFHLGDYQQFGFNLKVYFKDGTDESQSDEFWRDIIDLIEKNNLLCGGGGNHNKWEVFVASSIKHKSPTEKQRKEIENWLNQRWEVKKAEVGELVDVWNGWD